MEIVGYVDSNYVGDLDRRKSLITYVFTLGGCVISWKTTLESTVALSTTEAKYITVIEIVKEAIWSMNLVSNLVLQQELIVVYCDS